MQKESRARDNFIDENQAKYDARVGRLGNLLLKYIFDYFASEWTIEEGKIRNTVANINKAQRISFVQQDFINNEVNPIMRFLARSLVKLSGLNKKYFRSIPEIDNKEIDKANEFSNSRMNTLIGWDGKELVKGGILQETANLDDVFKRIRNDARKAAINNIPIARFRESVESYINQNKAVEKSIRRITGNIYAQYDREVSDQHRTRLKLTFAIYAGGKIRSTRDFCCERNNKVFHISEIQKFGTPDDEYGGYTDKSTGMFKGRNRNKIYNPLNDMGDENCRHRWNFISDQMALRRRPDAVKFLN